MRLQNKYIPSPDISHTNTDEDVVTTGGEPRLPLPVDEDDGESSQPVEELVAVSYTHLTLPTILLV